MLIHVLLSVCNSHSTEMSKVKYLHEQKLTDKQGKIGHLLNLNIIVP